MPTSAETALASGASSYNYYPNLMVGLCVISYEHVTRIRDLVAQQFSPWTVVWGPNETAAENSTYSRAFIARNPQTDEFAVVIRGTNFLSWDSWSTEDFDTHTTQPLSKLIPNAPAGAAIAQGTYNGVHDLNNLQQPASGSTPAQTMVEFLQQAKPGSLYVTGHSLGGTLVPPYFAYLNSQLYGGGPVHNMALWSFAGLTPGNAGFNTYFTGLFNPQFPWRIHNTLDIAPNMWGNQANLATLYSPTIPYGEPEKGLMDFLFDRAAGNGYAQPATGSVPLTGTLQAEKGWRWAEEAMYQHHGGTYQSMVKAAYPLSGS